MGRWINDKWIYTTKDMEVIAEHYEDYDPSQKGLPSLWFVECKIDFDMVLQRIPRKQRLAVQNMVRYGGDATLLSKADKHLIQKGLYNIGGLRQMAYINMAKYLNGEV